MNNTKIQTKLKDDLPIVEETLQSELKTANKKVRVLEKKNNQLLSKIYNLRRLLNRVTYEEDLNMIRLENKIEEKNMEIENYKDVLRSLEKNSKWLDGVADFWKNVVDNDEIQSNFSEKVIVENN